MTNPRFGRMITAMVTPFAEDGSLDLGKAASLADRLILQGTDAIVVCGTTGESPTVFYDQKIELFRAVIDGAEGRVPVIANVGDNCTDDSVAFARKVSSLGVDALMAVVPYYNKPPQEGLYRHFKTLADAVDLPVILYNIPARCAINMEPKTVIRLARDCSNIVALKQANPDLSQAAEIIDGTPEGFEVLAGDDELTLPMMAIGGTGVISVLSNIAGPRFKEMIEAQVAGDHTRALRVHLELLPLMKTLFITANPIMVKKAFQLIGQPVGSVRLPLIEATDEQTEQLAAVLKHLGLIQ